MHALFIWGFPPVSPLSPTLKTTQQYFRLLLDTKQTYFLQIKFSISLCFIIFLLVFVFILFHTLSSLAPRSLVLGKVVRHNGAERQLKTAAAFSSFLPFPGS